ncbi:MAG: C10 family peptidase, partial [Bacteroidota bacterium]
MRHILLILSFFIAIPCILMAGDDKVDETLAVQTAKKQFALFRRCDSKGFQNLQPYVQLIKSTNDTVTYYVVAFKNTTGFVIVPATSRVSPCIAVSSKDVFDTATIPPAMAYMLRVNERRVLMAIRAGNTLSDAPARQQEWNLLDTLTFDHSPKYYKSFRDSVGPLMTTQWGQESYYNQKCPYHGPACSNGHAKAGCGPVAMAQVLRYNEYPDGFNWANMPDALAESNNDVANLIRDCGEAAMTLYTCVATPTLPMYLQPAMKFTFGYSSAHEHDVSLMFNQQSDIIGDICDGFPVIMQGREEWNIFDWHIFVVDGKKSIWNYGWVTVCHINWGWEGAYTDMWFYLDSCDPPGDNGPYNYEQSYIHSLIPPGTITVTSPEA